MSGARIEIKADVAEVQAAFSRLIALGGDLHAVMESIGEAVRASTRHRFETGIGSHGLPWKKSAGPGKTLVDTGRLRDSISYAAGDASVRIGTSVRYAAIHQFGGTILPKKGKSLRFKTAEGWRNVQRVVMPARPFLGLDADDRAEILAIATDHVQRAFAGRQAGGGTSGAAAPA